MFTLNFSYNWNNKLDCHAFTTIRMYDPMKHFLNNQCEIKINNKESKGTGTIKALKRFLLKDLNAYMSYLDTGYSIEETKAIIMRMYKNIDFNTYQFAFILIVKNKEKKC